MIKDNENRDEETTPSPVYVSDLGNSGPFLTYKREKDGSYTTILNGPSSDATLSSAVQIITKDSEENK